jgi:hypothetical protein
VSKKRVVQEWKYVCAIRTETMRDMNIPNCVCHVSDMSCLCFSGMSIQFRFGEFRANSICPMFRVGHVEFLYEFDPCMRTWL